MIVLGQSVGKKECGGKIHRPVNSVAENYTTSTSLHTSDDQDERHKLRSGLEQGVRGHVGVTPDDVNGLQNTLRPLSGDGIRRSGALWVIVFHNTPYIYGLSARGRDALSAARTR